MSRCCLRRWLPLGAASLTALLLVTCTTAAAALRPNIVLILADDVGRDVLGSYGGESYPTPHLDDLAASGARLTHCYSMPVCHPSRTCLLTGRYPRRLGNPKWGSFPAAAESQTLAHVLKRAGYTTAIAGKWQLCLMRDDLQHPVRLGFDEWSLFGWHEGARYYDPMIYQNGALRADTSGKYGPQLYVDFLLDFIARKGGEQPFFAFYSMALCHDVTNDIPEPVPYGPKGRYDNYEEMVAAMDHQMGRLLAGLERMKLRDRTLILFTTDNGTAARSIIRVEDGKYLRDPVVSRWRGRDVSGGKGQLTDWGTRVPTLASWPGVIEPGQIWDQLVDFSDFLPTFAELSGGPLPEDVTLDGKSFARLLTTGSPSPRRWAYAERGKGTYFVCTKRFKLYNDGRIFDLAGDLDEKRPLAASDLPAAAADDLRLLREAMAAVAFR